MYAQYAIRGNKSHTYILPAPVKGLNRRDSLANMDPMYAVTMDNYIPYNDKVILRSGYIPYVSFSDKVGTLATYANGAKSELLAVSGHKVYNISSNKKIRSFSDIFLSDDNCQTVQYKNYLYFMNGIDIPKVYYIDNQGSEHLEDWKFTANNLNASAIIAGSVSKQRLWFIEKGTLRVWYAENAGNISGSLQCFDLSQVSRFGGHLAAVASWTQDGGTGIDDLTVFITSEGEALVYSGSNVADADDWKLRGSYKISRPIGYKCCLSYQGDVVIITQDGYIPLSGALPLDKANSSEIAFSDTIRDLVCSRTKIYASRIGWQGIIYARGGFAIFNVPLYKGYEQHIINVNTGAWCRFTDINSRCWVEFNKRLYFGSDNGVYLFDEGYSDNGKPIIGEVAQAYNDLGTDKLKKIQLINPRTKSLYNYTLIVYTNTDMQSSKDEYSENIGSAAGVRWNSAKWSANNKSGIKWENSGRGELHSQWICNSATGYSVSLVFKTSTSGNSIEWYETGLRYELGEGVL
ncbi:MAG: hypothetical protein IJ532_05450 [Alphaproteobacteria bacterium]|nr:hypothetical protein [Alphaproteobacteria bacterium]